MNSYFRKLFYPFFSHWSKNEKSRHFRNIANGPKVYINGKPYVKVKLRFIDTLDYNITRYIDKLETIVEYDKSEIENLISINEVFKQKINDLQNLNVNLVREFNIKNGKNGLTIKDLSDNLKTKDTAIEELRKTIQDSNPLIEFLKEQIILLESKIKTKDIRIRSLEAELQHLKSSKKYNVITKKEIDKLKRNPDKSLYSIFLKNKEIDEKDTIIEILTDKEKDYQRKIEILKKEIDTLNKK